ENFYGLVFYPFPGKIIDVIYLVSVETIVLDGQRQGDIYAAADVIAHFVELVFLLPVFGGIVRDFDVAVIFHTGSGRDQAPHDDVFLKTTQIVDTARNRRFSQDAGGLLEAGRRNK